MALRTVRSQSRNRIVDSRFGSSRLTRAKLAEIKSNVTMEERKNEDNIVCVLRSRRATEKKKECLLLSCEDNTSQALCLDTCMVRETQSMHWTVGVPEMKGAWEAVCAFVQINGMDNLYPLVLFPSYSDDAQQAIGTQKVFPDLERVAHRASRPSGVLRVLLGALVRDPERREASRARLEARVASPEAGFIDRFLLFLPLPNAGLLLTMFFFVLGQATGCVLSYILELVVRSALSRSARPKRSPRAAALR